MIISQREVAFMFKNMRALSTHVVGGGKLKCTRG